MVMKASLQLKMGQSLTMTPQLQQAIRLLQLSTLDLQQEIQQALDSNPMLETSEEEDNGDASDTDQDQKDRNHDESVSASEGDSQPDNSWEESDWSAENNDAGAIPDDLPVDTAWDDIYQSAPAPVSRGDDDNDMDKDFEMSTLY